MFTSLKTQYAGATLLLAWLYVDQAIWPRLNWMERGALLVVTFTVAILAGGAAYFILAYVVTCHVYRAVSDPPGRRDHLLTALLASLAFIVGKISNDALATHYQTASILAQLHLGDTLADSLAFIRTALSGGDTSGLKLLGFPGYTYFTFLLPWLAMNFVRANPIIVAVPLIGAFFIGELRILAALAAVLFVVGHAHVVLHGWTWYYGYSSAPAAHILIILTAICLGALYRSNRAYWRGVAVAAMLAAIYFFNADPAYNMKNFYSNGVQQEGIGVGARDVFPADRKLYVYHDDDMIRYW
jgi:hypothetical protein